MSTDVGADVQASSTAGPVPGWMFPPPEGFTAEDLDRLPDLPPHTELIDGSLVLVSPQKMFHMVMLRLLEQHLLQQVPDHLRIGREMTVTLSKRQRPEPDLVVVQADSIKDAWEQTDFPAGAVELAVEIVSPESEERDRARKPQLYADAGIPHFWRVEPESGKPAVYVYELNSATRSYALTGKYYDRLQLRVPFEIDVDLTPAAKH